MSEAKGLNRPLPTPSVMSGASYGGNGYSTQGLLRTGMAGLVGAALAVGAAGLEGRVQPALGQDVAKIAYQQTNLSSYGVPDVAALKPYQTRFADLTDRIPGHETRIDMHDWQGGNVALFSINGRLFLVAVDRDKRPPADHAYIDRTGTGLFTEHETNKKIEVPEWVLRQQ